jgi:hypothetical protein
MKTKNLVGMAVILFSALFVRAQETNEVVVGKLEHEKVVLTKVVGLVDYFRHQLQNDGTIGEIIATIHPDAKHVYIGTTVKGNSGNISSIGIIAMLHDGEVYVLNEKSSFAKTMDMNGMGSSTLSCKGDPCAVCSVGFTEIAPFVKCDCTIPDCKDCNCNMTVMMTLDLEIFE